MAQKEETAVVSSTEKQSGACDADSQRPDRKRFFSLRKKLTRKVLLFIVCLVVAAAATLVPHVRVFPQKKLREKIPSVSHAKKHATAFWNGARERACAFVGIGMREEGKKENTKEYIRITPSVNLWKEKRANILDEAVVDEAFSKYLGGRTTVSF